MAGLQEKLIRFYYPPPPPPYFELFCTIDVDNYIQRFVGSNSKINEQFTQPKTRNPKHTIKNGEEARLKLQTAARLA